MSSDGVEQQLAGRHFAEMSLSNYPSGEIQTPTVQRATAQNAAMRIGEASILPTDDILDSNMYLFNAEIDGFFGDDAELLDLLEDAQDEPASDEVLSQEFDETSVLVLSAVMDTTVSDTALENIVDPPATAAPITVSATEPEPAADENAIPTVASVEPVQDTDWFDADATVEIESPIENMEDATPIDPLTASTGSYIWPAHGNLSSRFGRRNTSIGSTNHLGIDISGQSGDPIYAADGGEVIFSGWSRTYGNVIRVLHDNGDITLYSHCSRLLVSVGERVWQGQQIARMGRTGTASGVHLHFELIRDGVNIDPLPHLN
jgi:murein DD-endopeptidase MepM/ murein hydrolase activator NlpD